ncbi:YczE/YyaS/YitT family protein [Cetobacterium somerae]|uniref:YczE/YyaS/YitT family protein n=1 Tax=Cetobacterium somerae TaxID=188913 RepID=UPI00248E6012|nr:DUF6198 family protein [Cetobacterium somerae]
MKLYFRITSYILGIIFLSLGIVLAVKSQLGISPISSLPFILSHLTQIDLGIFTTIFFIIFIILQMCFNKSFKIEKLLFLQFLFSLALGFFVSKITLIFNSLHIPENLLIKYLFLGSSILTVGLGLTLILLPNFVPGAPEGLMLIISKKFNIPFPKVKIMFDISMVLLASLISFIFLRTVHGIGIGTILSAILVGKVVSFFMKRLKPLF